MNYKPKYFEVSELVSKEFYSKWGKLSLQWLDAGLLHDLDVIREALDQPVIVNGRGYNWSGLRDEDFSGYSPTSAHTSGKAIDFKLLAWLKGDYSTDFEDVINLIKELKSNGKLKYINRMELGTHSWVHIDTFNRQPNCSCGLFLFNK